ncbi:MAG: hypothetical protein HY247_00325 [archaeon]|nr:MAG: hypothetical protein HY247_00325 [archaeon]
MAPRKVHHMDLQVVVSINKEVVSITNEPHEISQPDSDALATLLGDVESRATNQDFEEAVPEKASLLVFRIASGQHFKAGNKRTALVAGLTFLRKNGYAFDMRRPEWVNVVDKAGVAAADLDDLANVLKYIVKKTPTERKGWDNALKQVVETNRRFLRDVGLQR